MSLSQQFKNFNKVKFNLYTAKNELDKIFSFTLNLDNDNIFSYSIKKFENEIIRNILTVKLTFLFELCQNNLLNKEMKTFNEYLYEKYIFIIEILKQTDDINEINLFKFKVVILSWILYTKKNENNLQKIYSKCINYLYLKEQYNFFYDYLFKIPCISFIKEILIKCFIENNIKSEMIVYIKNIETDKKEIKQNENTNSKKKKDNDSIIEKINNDSKSRIIVNGGINKKLSFSRTLSYTDPNNNYRKIKNNRASLIQRFFKQCSKTREEYQRKFNTQQNNNTQCTKSKIRNIINGKFYIDEIISSSKKKDLRKLNFNSKSKSSKSSKNGSKTKNKKDNFENRFSLISNIRNKSINHSNKNRNKNLLEQSLINDDDEILAMKTKKMQDNKFNEKNINDSKRKRDYYHLFSQINNN